MDNWKLVPAEPTEEMTYAGATAMHNGESASAVFDAMLAAVPQPPALGWEPTLYTLEDDDGFNDLWMVPSKGDACIRDEGPWVHADDHRAHVARLQARSDELEAEKYALEDRVRGLQELLAQQPVQPVVNGLFKKNEVVDHLLEKASACGFDMNYLACQNFTDEDRQQFAQLIGYSLGGYSDLSYVSDEAWNRAHAWMTAALAEGAKS